MFDRRAFFRDRPGRNDALTKFNLLYLSQRLVEQFP